MTTIQEMVIAALQESPAPGWSFGGFRQLTGDHGTDLWRGELTRNGRVMKVDAWPDALSFWLDERHPAQRTCELLDFDTLQECLDQFLKALEGVLRGLSTEESPSS